MLLTTKQTQTNMFLFKYPRLSLIQLKKSLPKFLVGLDISLNGPTKSLKGFFGIKLTKISSKDKFLKKVFVSIPCVFALL